MWSISMGLNHKIIRSRLLVIWRLQLLAIIIVFISSSVKKREINICVFTSMTWVNSTTSPNKKRSLWSNKIKICNLVLFSASASRKKNVQSKNSLLLLSHINKMIHNFKYSILKRKIRGGMFAAKIKGKIWSGVALKRKRKPEKCMGKTKERKKQECYV